MISSQQIHPTQPTRYLGKQISEELVRASLRASNLNPPIPRETNLFFVASLFGASNLIQAGISKRRNHGQT